MTGRVSNLYRYGVALAAVAAVAAARVALDDSRILGSRPFLLFTFSIVLAGWNGGFGPALLASLLSTLAIDFFFLEPRYSIQVSGQDAVALALYLVQGFLISWLSGQKQRTLASLEDARNHLDERVRSRTAELSRYSEQLQASNRELQDFASVASHDLQEPLRKIQAFGDRLRVKCESTLSAEGLDYLSRMQNAAERMQVLIEDLLSFSRVTSKAQPFRPVDLAQVARDVVNDLETRIARSGGTVELGELPVIDADPLQMRQLLQNLIGNGLKFHKADVPPLVRVSAQLRDVSAGGERVPAPRCEVTVSDNGIGFDQKYADRIFTIFQRLHGRTTYEGTGIGLAICRKIVERHGGTIVALSQPEQGATFVVDLPAQQPRTNPGETS